MQKLLLIITTFTTLLTYSQESLKDTITLQEVKISKKEPKVITIKQGKGKEKIGNGFFINYPEQTNLIQGLPYGTLQSVTLHFMWTVKKKETGKEIPNTKIKATTFELILYELKEDKVGSRINDTPIQIQLPESRKESPSITIDLKPLNLTCDSFFAVLKLTSALPCDDCKLYIPMGYRTEKQQVFRENPPNLTTRDNQKSELYPGYHMGLLCEIKTLTQEY